MSYADDMIRRNEDLARQREQQYWQEATRRMGGQEGYENYYRGAAEGMYDLIDPVWGQPGYTSEEQSNILREQELKDTALTPEQQQSRFISPEEEAKISSYFRPELQEQIASDTSKAMTQAATNEDLQLSQRFSEAYPMSEQEKQDLISAGGMDVRDRYSAAIDSLNRQSTAEGSGAPGAATRRLRFEQQAAGQAGDTMIQARIAANQEAAAREKAMEEMRLGTTQDVANRQFQAAQAGGQMQLANEQDIRDYGAGQGKYFAENRQATETGNQQEAYNRALTQNQALSQRYADVAAQRMKESQEARQFATGQQQQAATQYNAAADRQVQGYSATAGAAGQAAGQATQKEVAKMQQPSLWEKISGAALGAVGGFFGGGSSKKTSGGGSSSSFAEGGIITEPTLALVGERGPEAVVPLTRQPNPRVPPRYADLGHYASRAFRPSYPSYSSPLRPASGYAAA
jgi:hypothetical protein